MEEGEVDVSKGLPSTNRSSNDSSQLSSKESTCFAVGEFLVVVLPNPNRSESKSPIEPNVLEARSLALVRRVRVRVEVPG